MFPGCFGSGGGVHGIGRFVEGVLDLAAQEGQDADDDESDERDEQAIFNEGLALFFLQKLVDHDECFPKNCAGRLFPAIPHVEPFLPKENFPNKYLARLDPAVGLLAFFWVAPGSVPHKQ